jgi:hypothetical protein
MYRMESKFFVIAIKQRDGGIKGQRNKDTKGKRDIDRSEITVREFNLQINRLGCRN